MIVLDTHIWIWWVHGDPALLPSLRAFIDSYQARTIGVSAISCWEVAKLVQLGRLTLPAPVLDWTRHALASPGVRLLDLSPDIAVESTRLPGSFHRDPADQLIVATARIFGATLVTADAKILAYPHVQLAGAGFL